MCSFMTVVFNWVLIIIILCLAVFAVTGRSLIGWQNSPHFPNHTCTHTNVLAQSRFYISRVLPLSPAEVRNVCFRKQLCRRSSVPTLISFSGFSRRKNILEASSRERGFFLCTSHLSYFVRLNLSHSSVRAGLSACWKVHWDDLTTSCHDVKKTLLC